MKDPVALLARLMALSWAGLWMFFFVVESWATHTPASMAMPWVGLGLIFLMAAVAAWRWEMAGGALLGGVGVIAAVAYALRPPEQLALPGRLATALFFGVPPLAAGILFLVHHRLAVGRH